MNINKRSTKAKLMKVRRPGMCNDCVREATKIVRNTFKLRT